MRFSASGWAVLSIALGLPFALQVACSAGGADSKPFGGGSTGGSGNGTGSATGSGSTGTGTAGSGTGNFTGFNTGGSSGTTGNDASACQPIVSQPEQITVYRDATVTDTIYTYSPIAIYIMQDRSGSMVTGFPTGSAQSWGNATTAITQFVNDPASAGLYVGLGSFPPYPSNVANNCQTDCNTPNVPIAALPGNAQAIANAYNTLNPGTLGALNFTPTECGLDGLVSACNAFEATSPGMPCVGLLITDGQPDACDTNVTDLSNILSSGATQGIKTFVIALNGVTDITFLNTLAQAGGTGSAIDLTQSSSSTAIVNALNTVRQKVATQVSSQVVTTQTVVSSALPCEWAIPNTIDRTMTNLQYTSATVTTPETLGHIQDDLVSSCGTGDAWYYDVPAPGTPTKVLLCPDTCNKVKTDTNPSMSLIFGCPTVDYIR